MNDAHGKEQCDSETSARSPRRRWVWPRWVAAVAAEGADVWLLFNGDETPTEVKVLAVVLLKVTRFLR